MTPSNFRVRRNQALLAEARTKLVLATRQTTPRERRVARGEALDLAERAKRALAVEFSAEPEDIPWSAATAELHEIEKLISDFRVLRQNGASSLEAWSETSMILTTLERATRSGT